MKVTQTDGDTIVTREDGIEILRLTSWDDKLKVGTSACLPANFEEAQENVEAYAKAFNLHKSKGIVVGCRVEVTHRVDQWDVLWK